MNRLRAVFFDIDDTLYSTTAFAAYARSRALQAMIDLGLRTTPRAALRELEEVIAEFGSNYQNHFDKLLRRLPDEALNGISRSMLIAAGITAYHDAKFRRLRPFPDVLPAMRRLARMPVLRGIITDGTDVKQAEKILRLGVFPMLTRGAIFISDEIGIAKPNPKIFERACRALDVDPRESVYVGDHPVKDIDAANAIGMTTVLAERGGRHGAERGRTSPAARVRDFAQLLQFLRKRFKVPLPR